MALNIGGLVVDPFRAPGSPAQSRPRQTSLDSPHADDPDGVGLLSHLRARLRGLGADDAELAEVERTWWDFDDDWTPERRREVALDWTDEQLARDLIDARREEAAARVAQANDALYDRFDTMLGDGATIDEVMAEVGSDPAKAAAALAVEKGRGDEARSTLVRRLEGLVG